jgi:hypothetical protein
MVGKSVLLGFWSGGVLLAGFVGFFEDKWGFWVLFDVILLVIVVSLCDSNCLSYDVVRWLLWLEEVDGLWCGEDEFHF